MYLDDAEFTKDESPLKFWKIKANKYPILSTIAAATFAPFECVFNHSGNVLRPKYM